MFLSFFLPFILFFLDDVPVIDADSDLEESEEDVEKDSGQQISDCESESFDEKPEDLPVKPTTVSEFSLHWYFLLFPGNPHYNQQQCIIMICIQVHEAELSVGSNTSPSVLCV